ncbi:hypothetical protein FRC07_010293 [Ceratobasidium sp. 392]|nr:hypothetical protein FRC07_010293 [Ceratobasidium sp. 392]
MAETVYNFTVADTSPMIAYSPYVVADATTGGWASVCPTYVTNADGQNSYMCDPESAHTTSSYKASFQLSFEGVGVYLIGNTTTSLGYDITLDGVHFPGNPKPESQILYSAAGLTPGAHTILLTVRQPASSSTPGSVTFKEAVVTAGTGLTGASVTRNIVDDGNPKIVYDYPPGGNWTLEETYPSSVGPEGVSSTTFHDSYWPDATATLNFQGTGVFAYGACYSHSRYAAYSASVDDAVESSLDGTVNLYSAGGDVKQRAGNCLRYYKTGLDASKDHKLVLKVKAAGRMAVDWVEVVSATGGAAADNGGHSGGSGGGNNGGTSSGSSSSMTGIIAGAVSGGVVLVLALLALAIFFRRRKNKRDEPEPEKDFNEPGTQTGYVTTPYYANPQPPMGYNTVPITPPWPQPQSPGPEHLVVGMGTMGAGNRMSVASSGAPLVSPGVPSTYSGSTGPGWSSGTGSHNNHGPSVEYSGSTKVGMGAYNNIVGFNQNSGSNMAVEAGGSSSRFDASSLRPSTLSPGPPAYDHGGYMTPPPASVKGQQF